MIERGERLEQPDDCPEEVFSVMRDCWAYDPQERPSFAQLVEIFSSHPEYMNISELVLKDDKWPDVQILWNVQILSVNTLL